MSIQSGMGWQQRNLAKVAADYLSYSRAISAERGRSLSLVLLRMILCRIRHKLGPLYFVLYNLDGKAITEWGDYLTKDDMDRLESAINPAEHACLADNKLLFYERCLQRGVTTPAILGVVLLTDTYVPAGIPVASDEQTLCSLLARHDGKRLILKAIDGSYGAGVLSIQPAGGTIRDHAGKYLSAAAILKHCAEWRASFLIQEHLTPHEKLRPVMPGIALGAIRVVTLQKPGGSEIHVPYAFAKIPVAGNASDNFLHGNTGNLLCGIDVKKGTLMNAWGKKPGARIVSEIERHPDSGAIFRDRIVPCWPEVLAVATQAARAFSELRTLGWDIAITDAGIYVLEANWHYDPDGPQVTLNRGIRPEITNLYFQASRDPGANAEG